MTLLAPAALWLSAVAFAVVGLYLLKIKRRRESVPALEFWRRLAGQTQMRSLFQRLKRWVSLFLWLLIVACLILAVGNPVLTLGRVQPQSIAVIIDNSASMQTVEGGEEGTPARTRLAAAIEAVSELTERRPVDDEWLLVDAARRPRVVQPWTRDRKAVCDSANVKPFAGAVDLTEAKALASQLLEGKERPCIVIISDGAAGQAAKLAAADEALVHWPIGESRDNLGVTRLSVRPHRQQASHHAYVRVDCALDSRVEADLVFEIDGAITSVEPMTIEPRGYWEKTVVFNQPEGGVLTARIDRPDSLAADDEASAILQPIEQAAILLVTPLDEAFFFEQALAAMDTLVNVELSATMSVAEYDALEASDAPFDVTIFNNCEPSQLPTSGRFIFVNALAECVPGKVVGAIDAPSLSIVRKDHPLTQYLNLSAVGLARAKRIDISGHVVVLAQSSDGSPLIFLHAGPNRRSLCLAFDVMESDMPFRNAFPIFLRNAVSFLMAERSAWLEDQYCIGDVIEPMRTLPMGVDEVLVARLNDEALQEEAIPVVNGAFSYDRTEVGGPLRFTVNSEMAYAAVNLMNEGESRITPDRIGTSPEERLSLTGRLFGAVPWYALAALASVLVGLEWLTYHRRWTE